MRLGFKALSSALYFAAGDLYRSRSFAISAAFCGFFQSL
jgi:hypothetical protein